MNQLNVFNLEVAALNILGQCSLCQTKAPVKFYYNRRLFVCQLIGIVLYFLGVNHLKNYELQHTRSESSSLTTLTSFEFSEENKSPDLVVSSTLMSIHEVFMNYVMVMVLLMRWTKQKRIARIYNNLIDIQNRIESLNTSNIRVTNVTRQFIIRSVVTLLFETMFAVDEFQPYSFRDTKTKAFTVFLHRIVFRFALLQFFTFHDVIKPQAITLTRLQNDIRTGSDMEKVHRTFTKIIHTNKLIDKVLSKEFVLDTTNSALYIVLTLYLYCIRAEKELNVVYHTEDAFLNERSITFLTLWTLIELNASKKRFVYSHSFVSGADKRTFWTIICSSFSVLMIILQFRDITTIRRSARLY